MLAIACGLGQEHRTLISRRQETAAETIETARWNQPSIDDDETGQLLIFGPQTVSEPSPHAGPALEAAAGMQEVIGIGVFGEFRRHRLDDRQFISDFRQMWKQRTDPVPAVAMLLERPAQPQARCRYCRIGLAPVYRSAYVDLGHQTC